jgi:hypothetical protein
LESEENLENKKSLFYASSASLRSLIHKICPRYIYSSTIDKFEKATPFLNKEKFLSRFIGIGSLPGKYKSPESK